MLCVHESVSANGIVVCQLSHQQPATRMQLRSTLADYCAISVHWTNTAELSHPSKHILLSLAHAAIATPCTLVTACRLATLSCHLPPPPASVTHTPAGDDAIKHLLSRGAHRRFGYKSLIVMLAWYFIFAALAAGSAISSGLFVPMLMMGATVGRIVGLATTDIADKYGSLLTSKCMRVLI